jgi:DNA-binding GntR family transcriptional regulator
VTVTEDFDPHEGTAPAYVYMRIADHVAGRIAAGELGKGAKLPGEAELAQSYGVGLGTVRRAMDVLRSRGLVTTLKAKGTYVL